MSDKLLTALEEIEAWKMASGLMRGEDPDGVTPGDLSNHLAVLQRQITDLREALSAAQEQRRYAENVVAEYGMIIESIEVALDGKEPSDFALSFDLVRKAYDTRAAAQNWIKEY